MAMFPTDPSSVTADWLSEVRGADVWECRLEQIGIGVGLLGRLYRAHLDGAQDVPASVVVKLPLIDSRVRTELCEDLGFYLREVRFCRRRRRSGARSARRSVPTARRTRGHMPSRPISATGESCRSAYSTLRTRNRRSLMPTSRSGRPRTVTKASRDAARQPVWCDWLDPSTAR